MSQKNKIKKIPIKNTSLTVNESFSFEKIGKYLLDFGTGLSFHTKLAKFRLSDVWEKILNSNPSKRPNEFLRNKSTQKLIKAENERLKKESLKLGNLTYGNSRTSNTPCVHKIQGVREHEWYATAVIVLEYIKWADKTISVAQLFNQMSASYLQYYKLKEAEELHANPREISKENYNKICKLISLLTERSGYNTSTFSYSKPAANITKGLFNITPKEFDDAVDEKIRPMVSRDCIISYNLAQKKFIDQLEERIFNGVKTSPTEINELATEAAIQAKRESEIMGLEIKLETHNFHSLTKKKKVLL
ncbi:KilA-N domain-containing protein [Candidatus Phytoplasma pruni]|uniref:KilA-N domain-containing protein n=1 Tax=Candidatus Phytoplasma pruni TaxID=479893 RepID=A0A851HIY1_9MOLU|nr:KilA-N domain-containing protein [Candidatus Phytoplasma pruni]NWN45506.1 KilA-N domain-containing protein [Candidatus Phytoplasma pruni]